MEPEVLLGGHPVAEAVFAEVRSRLAHAGRFEVHATKSQIAFRAKKGFVYLWLPGQYLRNPDAEVVLSIALGRRIDSVAWLREALERAS